MDYVMRSQRGYKYYKSIYDDPFITSVGLWIAGLANWQWIISVTFEYGGSQAWARQCFETVMKKCVPEAVYLAVVDRHRSGEHHIHGVISSLSAFKRLPMQDELNRRYGRSEIKPYIKEMRWCQYLAKKIKFGGEVVSNIDKGEPVSLKQ
jgi:hypothetical protein